MITERINNKFDDVDSVFTLLYESQNKFDKSPTNENKDKLLKTIQNFKVELRKYEQAIKDLYIGKKGLYEKDNR